MRIFFSSISCAVLLLIVAVTARAQEVNEEASANVTANAGRTPGVASAPTSGTILHVGKVRGYVKDSMGKPLQGAYVGVRSSAVGGAYSGASGETDANGYYEIAVPWGAAHFYAAGYTID
ncbi:MAG: pollen Ole e 1 allergen/extensin family protein [Acidobacteriota bacterium]|nr:pollen Ole e 1 allergen/extensin family protein [Acidobacteriota bacterium]